MRCTIIRDIQPDVRVPLTRFILADRQSAIARHTMSNDNARTFRRATT